MNENRSAFFWNASGSLVTTKSSAPSRNASSRLLGEWLSTVTFAPMALASFTPMWPRPPRPTTATLSPAFTPKWRSGE
ncbi:hypothetical protein D3C72_1083640 [compost metagenome]